MTYGAIALSGSLAGGRFRTPKAGSRMIADYPTAKTFLERLGHPVAIVALKPLRASLPHSRIIWPIDQDDPADIACGLSEDYKSIYCNLNPLKSELLQVAPPRGVSVRDAMIAKRSRVLIDIDAHHGDKDQARDEKDAIKSELGPPLIEADSGNGFGLIYSCDLPASPSPQLQTFLEALASRFPHVDTSVHTLSRLTRVIGTLNTSRADGIRIKTLLLCQPT